MKYISATLILALLYYCLGCTSTSVFKKTEGIRDELKNNEQIYVTTSKGITYFYDANTYKFENDTLYGEAQKLLWDKKQETELKKIAAGAIKRIEITKSNPARTILLIVGLGVFVLFVGFLIAMQDLNLDIGEN